MATILEVSALNRYVQSILQDDSNLQDVAIRGEIGNFTRHHKTGHCYFTLSDAKAGIKAVMFRTQAERLSFRPTSGMRVIARGKVSLYERDGSYQIYIDTLFQEGIGEQKIALEALQKKLQQEGLFDKACKKSLPHNAWHIGVITSKSGAALQDILQVAQRRNPCARVILAAVSVQGSEAAAQVTTALKKMDEAGLDTIIIARGGGSAEDLSAFQDEALARAVFAAKTPVLSAIGHEIDFTILDFVADMRAPTPSAAAELAFANLRNLLQIEKEKCINYGIYIHNRLHLCYNELNGSHQKLALCAPSKQLQLRREKLERIALEIKQNTHNILNKNLHKLQKYSSFAEGLNPYAVLSRGYTVVKKDGKPIGSVLKLQSDDKIEIHFEDGQVRAQVQEITPRQEANVHE